MAGIHQIARQAQLRDNQINAVFEAVQANVLAGERVVIKNFGVFYLYETPPRTIFSPLVKGKKKTIPGYRRMKFKPSKHMRLTVVTEKTEESGTARGTKLKHKKGKG